MLDSVLENYVRKNLSEKRYIHSLNVAKEAEILAKKYGADTEKAYIAGIAHDLAKEIPLDILKEKLVKYKNENLLKEYPYPLLHGPAAALILKNEFKVTDDEILDAVYYHTTGKCDMHLLTKIIYIADFIEPGREFDGVEKVRDLAKKSLDEAIIAASGIIIIQNVRKGRELHTDTINARNFLLKTYKNIELDF